VAKRLAIGLDQVFAAIAQWEAAAAPFAVVVPPVIEGTSPSAVAVGGIHAAVTASHAAFGARLLETAASTQQAGVAFSIFDGETAVQSLTDVVSGLDS
jgi:hypothetical protein